MCIFSVGEGSAPPGGTAAAALGLGCTRAGLLQVRPVYTSFEDMYKLANAWYLHLLNLISGRAAAVVVTCCANIVAGGQAWACFQRVSNKNGQSNFDGSVPLGYSQFSIFSVRWILISRLLSVHVGTESIAVSSFPVTTFLIFTNSCACCGAVPQVCILLRRGAVVPLRGFPRLLCASSLYSSLADFAAESAASSYH